jgi:uncharacterized membrane protein YcgQ (UPF0703/DUF1980 family)
MTLSLRVLIRSVVLAVWGVVCLYFVYTDRLPLYIAPGFRPLVPIAGIVLVFLAVVSVFAPAREPVSASRMAGRRRSVLSYAFECLQVFLMLAPIIASAVVAPSSYSATTVLNRLGESDSGFITAPDAGEEMLTDSPSTDSQLDGVTIDSTLPMPGDENATAAATTDAAAFDPAPYIPRDEKGRVVVELTELWTAAADPGFRKNFKPDTELTTLAQLLVPKGARDAEVAPGKMAQFKVARMMILCCAADARPIAVQVEAPAIPEGKDTDWVQLAGRIEFKAQGGEIVPIFHASEAKAAEAPDEIYLSY